MNYDLAEAAVCYGLYDENNIIGFAAVLHQPHEKNKKIKRMSRIVVLPDYQGIGLGYKFLNFIADMYAKQGYDFSIVTSAKNFMQRLSKSNKWACIRYSVNKKSNSKSSTDCNKKSVRNNCKTASFFYRR